MIRLLASFGLVVLIMLLITFVSFVCKLLEHIAGPVVLLLILICILTCYVYKMLEPIE